MKKSLTCVMILLWIPHLLTGQSDLPFFLNSFNHRHLTYHTTAACIPNPSVQIPARGFYWSTSITNHFEIRNFNTLSGALALQKNNASLLATIRYASLSDLGYHRTASTIGAAVRFHRQWSGGAALKTLMFRLPENHGSNSFAGITIGLSGKPSQRFTCGLAGGYFLQLPSHNHNRPSVTQIDADFQFHQSKKCTLSFSSEMVQGLTPVWMASVILSPMPGIIFSFGAGNGSTLMNAGLLLNLHGVAVGTLSSFNPICGRSHSVFIHSNPRTHDKE